MTTAETERWAIALDAVEDIRERLGISVGKAQKILRDACASGEVRYKTNRQNLIGPVRTSPNSVNFAKTASDTIIGSDTINVADLKYWLADHYPAKPKIKKSFPLDALKKWLREHVNRMHSEPYWRAAAEKVHPQYQIPRERWREAWSTVPEPQKRRRGKPAA